MPRPAWSFDGVVRLTRVGTSFLVFTLVIGFAALNTGNNALYIGLSFMLGLLLLSGIASKGGLKHLRVEIVGVDEAWARRPVDCILRVHNRSRIWNVRDVILTSDELAQPVLIPLVGKRAHADVNAAFLFARRGVVELKRVELYTRYPFGFILKKRRATLSGEVVVYPALLGDEDPRVRFRPILGEQVTTNRVGAGTEIHSFREYVRGDSLRQVYWKKSASLGRWIIKLSDHEAAHVVDVVVETYKPRSASDDEFEEMISAAATFLYHTTRRGLSVHLSLGRVSLQAASAAAASAMFRALAVVEPTYEPVEPPLGVDTVVFTLRRSDERATA